MTKERERLTLHEKWEQDSKLYEKNGGLGFTADPTEPKKKLEIYKDQETGDFVMRRTNEFGHRTKREFISEQGLLEGLAAYRSEDLNEYELQVSDELWGTVIHFLQNGEQ
jgi:hypothetical protein